MPYIKLKVRSGGIYIKQKKPYELLDLDLSSHPEDNNQQVLSLIRESSIKGLFSYLMGETKKLKDIENSTNPSVQKLNSSLNLIVKSVAYKKISDPHITTFFERRDNCNKSFQFVYNPKVNLYHHNFKTADPTIKLLKAPLEVIMKRSPQSLGDIHSVFEKNIIKYEKQKDKYEPLIKKASQLDKELEKKIPKANQILKKGIKTALKQFFDKKPISEKVISLIEEIYNLYGKDSNFKNKIQTCQYGKLSIFTYLKGTKQWIDKEHYSIVRGTPAFIAQVDFDIYLSEGSFDENRQANCLDWGEIIQKIKQGPNLARWGEGGVVFIKYCLDEMGRGFEENQQNQMFIEISALKK